MKHHYPKRYLALFALLTLLLFCGCSPGKSISIEVITRTPQYSGQIFIGGAVRTPGIYPFTNSDTLSDLLDAAGGLLEGYDAGQVTLAVAVPTGEQSGQKININTAEEWLLEALPGIGPANAANIVSYRRQNGLFRSVTDLLEVPGIGPATLDKILPLITVSPEDSPDWP